MDILKRLSEWSDLDWRIAFAFLLVTLLLWTSFLFFIHVLIVRKNVKAVQSKYERLVKPYLFGDNNQTVKEQVSMKKVNKENW